MINGVFYVFGGNSGSRALATVESYNPATDTWTSHPPMMTARTGAVGGAVDGVLYAVGGQDGPNKFTSVEAYAPRQLLWTSSDPSVATVSTTGLVTAGVRPGRSTVTVTSGRMRGSVTLTVVSPTTAQR